MLFEDQDNFSKNRKVIRIEEFFGKNTQEKRPKKSVNKEDFRD